MIIDRNSESEKKEKMKRRGKMRSSRNLLLLIRVIIPPSTLKVEAIKK